MKFKDTTNTTNTTNIEDTLLQIVSALANRDAAENLTLDSRFKNDLGFDSLSMLQMCVEIEGTWNISIENKIGNIKTVRDIIPLLQDSGTVVRDTDYDIEDYPISKTDVHIRQFKRYMRFSSLIWRFSVTGLENIPSGGRFILCPNHQSHFDGLWVWTALRKKNIDLKKISCLAKQEHLKSKTTRSWLAMLGGIPVDRTGNTVPAMKRALACLNDGYTMLIHPEGTRSRDGKIHEFKGGAAKLAIDADVPLIPVRIEGAWDIFPFHRKRPKIFRLGRRYPIIISFGKPIMSDGKIVDQLTAELQMAVEQMNELR